jgi:hypothetical protein
LKALIIAKFQASDPKVASTLADYTEDAAAHDLAATKVLREVGVDRDQEVVDQALALLKQAGESQPGVTDTGGLVGQLNAQSGRVVVIGGTQAGTINMGPVSVYATATLDPRERKDRTRMLQRVRRIWVDGFFADSLHGAALQALGLEERPEAVPDRWGMVVQQPGRPAKILSTETSIVEVFDELDGELLILGEPGSGKTTVLLELTSTLLERAEHDEALPIPIVFPLAPWAAKRLPLEQWLIDELSLRYDVPRQIGYAWVTNDRVLPLLDGLDEVAVDHRADCVEAINAYRTSRTTLSCLVVTSRMAEYRTLAHLVRLRGAVLLQPLRPEQIDAYLAHAGPQLAGVRAALPADVELRELATSPLLLSTITLAYRGLPAEAISMSGTLPERRGQLFATYVQRMYNRRAVDVHYSREQTLHWLGWLARALTIQAQTIFYVERLQPEWLPTPNVRRWYNVMDRVASGLVVALLAAVVVGVGFGPGFGLAAGLASGLIGAMFGGTNETLGGERPTRVIIRGALAGWLLVGLASGALAEVAGGGPYGVLSSLVSGPWLGRGGFDDTGMSGLAFGLVVGLAGGLAGALSAGPAVGTRHIRVVETISWSTAKTLPAALTGTVVGLVLGLVLGLVVGLAPGLTQGAAAGDPVFGLGVGLVWGPIVGLAFGLVFGLLGGLTGREVEAKVSPNQGIRRSGRTSIMIGLASVLVACLGVGLAGWLVLGLGVRQLDALTFRLIGPLEPLIGIHDVANLEFKLALGLVLGIASGPVFGVTLGLIGGLIAGLLSGITCGLVFGGYACMSHGVLRLILWRSGVLPLRTIHFLDHATERIFLRRVGGGYIFVHRLLQDYFATLE